MTRRQAEKLLAYLDARSEYDHETTRAQFTTPQQNRRVTAEDVAAARAAFLAACTTRRLGHTI